MSVDKVPHALGSFAALAAEARWVDPKCAVVLVASLSGRNGYLPMSRDADRTLEQMIESVKAGSFGGFIPFDRYGQPLLFDSAAAVGSIDAHAMPESRSP